MKNFQSTMNTENSFTFPPIFFAKDKPFILVDIPFCKKNENKVKDFIKKFHHFTNGKYSISRNWIKKKL